MNPTLEAALDQFVQRFLDHQRATSGELPHIEYDPEWPSLCYQDAPPPGEQVHWAPVRQREAHPLFDGLAQALGEDIHPDIRTYYGRYWSDPLPARSPDGDLSLLFLWNEHDYERLRGNLVGHALAKRKQRQPLTLFFACTEPEDLVISIDNDSGQVLLEQPGRKPLRTLAPSLAEFIASLEPRAQE